jgi:hypothetical protein
LHVLLQALANSMNDPLAMAAPISVGIVWSTSEAARFIKDKPDEEAPVDMDGSGPRVSTATTISLI